MRSNPQSSSSASLAALVSAGSLAALMTPSNSSNIKGLSLNLAPTAAPAASSTSAARSMALIPPASVSPNGYHPYQLPGSGSGNTRQAPSCASTLDDRPTKRRRPAGSSSSSSAVSVPAISIPVQPAAPFTMMSPANMPLTPSTPTSQFHFGSCSMGPSSSSSASFSALPSAPLTPVSPVDMVQHQLVHPQQQQQQQQQQQLCGAPTAPIAIAAYAFDPRPPSAASTSGTSPPLMNAPCRSASFPHFQHQQHLSHAAELARRQVSPATASSGIFLVAEHRGLVKESSPQLLQQQQSVAGASQVGPRGDGILAVVPNDGLELMFRTEARLPICDHFLYQHTNMSGGCQVAFARKHTIGWLIELNAQHQLFRYKTNTMCVAVQYLDRFLDCLAREGAALAVGAPLPGPAIVGPRNACGPHFAAQKPAPLLQWRSYDWYVTALVCLSLAAKMVEEYDDPTMRDMIGLDFHADHIRQTQLAICKALAFDLGAASPVNFLVEYAALPPVRDLVAELLPQNPHRHNASAPHSPLPGHEANHGLATPPLSPPASSQGSPGNGAAYSSPQPASPTNPAEPRTSLDKIPTQAPSADLEQFQSMVAPAILNRVQEAAETYLIAVLPYPESASYTASELAMAALNLALEIRSLKAHAIARVHPVTGAHHVDYLPKSLALGFYGSAMTERTHRARDLMLAILPRERFFASVPATHQYQQHPYHQHQQQMHAQQQQQQQQQHQQHLHHQHAQAANPPVVASQ